MKIIFTFLFGLLMVPLLGQQDYDSYERLQSNIKELAQKNKSLQFQSIGKSVGGKDIWVVKLSQNPTSPKPALLISAGFDGRHPAGTQMAMLLLEQLVNAPDFNAKLQKNDLYFLPLASPDAYLSYFSKPLREKSGNATKTDDDRDGFIGEDPFEDLNKDGLITMVRIEDMSGTHIISDVDSRIMVKADPSKQQVGKYMLITEGVDNDKDGQYNEDGSDGVNIDRNFTFDYKPFSQGSGAYAASEPETRAVVDFMFDHPNIYAVIHLGLYNNLNEPPKYDSKLAQGRIIKTWLENDAKVAALVSKLYTDQAGLKVAPKMPAAPGNFSQTVYYHTGKFSFSTPGWWTPKVEEVTDTTAAAKDKMAKTAKEESPAELSFLKWADKEGLKNVFVDWKSINHPDFPGKKAEVGGLVPYALHNPPKKYLEESVAEHKTFLENVLSAMPNLETETPKVEKLQDQLYRITLKVANKGLLPTYAEIGDKVRFTSRFKTQLELNKSQAMVTGRKVILENAMQPDEIRTYTWLISGKGKVKITTGCATTGTKEITVDLN
ncbi:MAG: M14 family metallopeptidase [Flavobacterium sp.]